MVHHLPRLQGNVNQASIKFISTMYFKTGAWDKGGSWQIFRPVLLHSSSHPHATFSCTISQMQSESSYLNWTLTDTTVATKIFSFLDTLCYAMEDYLIFGHLIGNQVIWVRLSIKHSVKNVLKFRELLAVKVNAEGYPYPCIDTKSCIFFITINRFQC